MIARYTRDEMGALWSPAARYAAWLQVELAVCEVYARRGRIPSEAVERIRRAARIDARRIDELEATTRHDVVAFLAQLEEAVGADSRFIHLGLTSSDVVHTALALQLQRAADLLLHGLERLRETLRRLALAHKETLMVGRTHGVHAEPTTFGLKAALWHAEAGRNLERLRRAKEAVRAGKISGAVGTFAHVDPDVEEEVCRELGLVPEPVSTQVVQRDRHAEFVGALALLAASLEKIALEIRNLQRTEVLEAEEPFAEGQTGSSAMPHKRNPVGAEQVCGLARLVRANALAALEDVALWHERDISHSSVERVILPDSTSLVDYMLHQMDRILAGLQVYPARMRENLDRTHGLIFSQRVLLALTERGLPRQRAYELVQRNAMRAWRERRSFHELLAADPDVTATLTPRAPGRAHPLRGDPLRARDALPAARHHPDRGDRAQRDRGQPRHADRRRGGGPGRAPGGRVLLQVGRARRPDDQRRPRPPPGAGDPPGTAVDPANRPPRERGAPPAPGPAPAPARRLQARVRPRGPAARAGGRDLPGHLSALGRPHPRAPGQGSLPARPRGGRGGLPGGVPAPGRRRGPGAVKARVLIRLKRGILDVQGSAVLRALAGLGYAELRELRVGKVVELDLDAADPTAAAARVEEMCRKLLANPVTEDFSIECPLPCSGGGDSDRGAW